MKNILNLIKGAIILLVGFTLYSCNKYQFSIGVLVPADITISQDIQSVGVLNRSLPDKGNFWGNLLEGFVSGESIFADKEGSFNAIRGAANTLNVNPRFRATLMEGEDYKGTGTKQFPIPLEWKDVSHLCEKYGVDALIVLETFDSDVFLRTGSRERTKKEGGNTIKYLEYFADLSIRVNSGWRFYDNVNKRLIDQQVFTDEKIWTGVGLSPQEAMRKLPAKRAAINDAAIFSGEMLAFRISPKWITVNRTLYKKGGGQENFKKAKKEARAKNWEEVGKLMEPITKVSDNKVAARAAHNMAVVSEMDARLNDALEWSKKSYSLHSKSLHRQYVNIISTRIMDQTRLKEQLEGN